MERRWRLGLRRLPVLGTHAAELAALIDKFSVDCVVDVGAHHGEFASFLRNSVFFPGKIVSFEPFPASFDELAERARHDSGWMVRDLAVGASSGSVALNTFTASTLNSMRQLNEVGRGVFSNIKREVVIETEIARLDDLYDQAWGTRLLIKSDTQGNDLEVLSGCDRILDKICGVQIEAGFEPLYDGAPSLIDVVEHLESVGFGAVSFNPVWRPTGSLVAVEFDVLFARL